MSVEFFHDAAASLLAVVSLLVLGHIWVLVALHRRYLRLLEAEQAFAAYAGKVHQLILVNLGVVQSKLDELQALRSIEQRDGGGDVVH